MSFTTSDFSTLNEPGHIPSSKPSREIDRKANQDGFGMTPPNNGSASTGVNLSRPPQSSFQPPHSDSLISVLGLLRIVGYALIIFAWIDLLYSLIPPKFTDPVWEFQTIGEWFERVPVFLLGCVLVFYQGPHLRRRIEPYLLCTLSWLNLLFAICLLLLVPLCASNAVQINRLNNAEINVQIDEQTQQIDQAKDRILNAPAEALETLLLPEEQAAEQPDAPRTVQAAKEVALENLETAQERSQSQAEQARQNLKRNLLKNTVRLGLGHAISAFTLLYAWKLTRWARDLRTYRQASRLQNQRKGKPGKTSVGLPFASMPVDPARPPAVSQEISQESDLLR